MTIPPPTPKSALKTPATSADAREREGGTPRHGHRRILGWVDADARLAALVAAPGRTALLFDVDGTLAPIAPGRSSPTVPEETRAVLTPASPTATCSLPASAAGPGRRG